MKKIPTLPFFLILVSFLVSCHTKKQTIIDTHTVTDTTSVRIDTIINTRLIPYVTPEDSALIQLGLRCDSNGRVLINNYTYEHTRALNLEYSLDSLNRLMFKARNNPDTVFIPVNDTTVNKTLKQLREQLDQKQTTITEYVDKPLTWFQKFFMEIGKVCVAVAFLIILFFVGKLIFETYFKKIF